MEQKLCRSETDRMLGGVCGGLAEYLAVDSVWVRLVAVLLIFANGLGLIAYIVLWIVMPSQSKIGLAPKEVAREGVEEMKETAKGMGERARELAQEARTSITGSAAAENAAKRAPARGSYVVAAILIVVGLILILSNFGLLWWLHIWRLWPLILIIVGVSLLLRRRRA